MSVFWKHMTILLELLLQNGEKKLVEGCDKIQKGHEEIVE